MLGLIERLDHVRAAGLDAARGHRVHQARLAQLVREAGRSTVQHVAGYERQRRHATLVAVALEPRRDRPATGTRGTPLRAREQPQGPADLTLKLNYSNMQLVLEAAECDRMSRIA